MTGIAITFGSEGVPVFNTGTRVTDFDATVQNALVCLGTTQGTDPIFSERGTDLLKSAVQGQLTNIAAANHACNFAANRVLIFMQQNDSSLNTTPMKNFQLQAAAMKSETLWVDVVATAADGQTRGVITTL